MPLSFEFAGLRARAERGHVSKASSMLSGNACVNDREWYSLEKVETETTAGFICCFVMEGVAD